MESKVQEIDKSNLEGMDFGLDDEILKVKRSDSELD